MSVCLCVWKMSNIWGGNTQVGNCDCFFTSTGVDPMAGSFCSTTRSPLELTSSWQAGEWHQWEWSTILWAKPPHNEWQGAGWRISCLWTWKESFSSFFSAPFLFFLSSRCVFPQTPNCSNLFCLAAFVSVCACMCVCVHRVESQAC